MLIRRIFRTIGNDAVAAMKGAAIASTATVHRAGRYCNGLPAVTVHDTLEACREVS